MKEIRIDGFIGDVGNTTEEFALRMEEKGIKPDDDITVAINSFGGSVFDGWSIYNLLKNHKGEVTTRIDGVAASIASVIALAGDKIHMSEISSFMIHKASIFVEGNSDDLEVQKDVLDKIDATLIMLYSAKTGKKADEVEELIKNETWFSSEEALNAGFVDEIVNKIDVQKIAASFNFNKSNSIMSRLDKFMAKLEKFGFKNADEEEGIDPAKIEITKEPKNVEVPDEMLQAIIDQLTELLAGADQAEEEAETATEETAKLVEKITALEKELAGYKDQLPDEAKIAESVEDAITEKLENVVSLGKVPKGNSALGRLAGQGSAIDSGRFVNDKMKEISAKTRLD